MFNQIYWKLAKYDWFRRWRGLPEPKSLTSAQISQEALSILEERLVFVTGINQFTKYGDGVITIQKPAEYTEKQKQDALMKSIGAVAQQRIDNWAMAMNGMQHEAR